MILKKGMTTSRLCPCLIAVECMPCADVTCWQRRLYHWISTFLPRFLALFRILFSASFFCSSLHRLH